MQDYLVHESRGILTSCGVQGENALDMTSGVEVPGDMVVAIYPVSSGRGTTSSSESSTTAPRGHVPSRTHAAMTILTYQSPSAGMPEEETRVATTRTTNLSGIWCLNCAPSARA